MALYRDVTLPLEIYILISSYLSPRGQLAFLHAFPQIAAVFPSRYLAYKGRHGNTVMHSFARKSNNVRIFKDLISKEPVRLYPRNDSGITPLMYAAANGNLLIMQALLERDISGLNMRNKDGSSALFYAVEEGFGAGVYLLLTQPSIDPNGRNNYSRPLIRALDKGHREIARALILHPKTKMNSIGRNPYTPLNKTLMKHDQELAEFMILNRREINVNYGKDDIGPPLHIAITHHLHSICELLLAQKKTQADLPNSSNKTPLIMAVISGNLHGMKLLLARNDVNVDSVDDQGRSALSYAVERTSIYVRLLLKHGARPDLEEKDGRTPMFRVIVAPFDRNEILELLKTAMTAKGTLREGP
ncbi:ankyrin repeat-containing domain protein [Aspergillus insuetus]